MSNPLDPRAILALTTLLLPRSSSSSPLPRPTDAVAALAHAIHTALGFRLTGAHATVATPTRPSGAAGPSSASASSAFAPASASEASTSAAASASAPPPAAAAAPSATTEDDDGDDSMSEATTAVDPDESLPNIEQAPPGTQLSEGWNARGEDAYSFEYTHPQSSMTFRVRVGRIGGRVQIDAMAEDGEPFTLSLVLSDLVEAGAFPVPSHATAGPNTRLEGPRSIGCTSMEAIRSFVDRYNREVIARLIPGLAKEGYRAPTVSSQPPPPGGPPPNRPNPEREPARPRPFADPLHPQAPPAGAHPASVGHRDLDPLGTLRPGGGLGDPASGGMLMDFNHPLFAGRRGGPAAGGVPDPSGVTPPGARYDPVGPGFPGGGPGGGRFPGPGGNPLGGTGLGDPEFGGGWGDELPPPGEFGPMGQPRFPGGPRRGGGGLGGGFGGGLGGFGGGGFGGGGFGGGGGGGGGGFGGGFM